MTVNKKLFAIAALLVATVSFTASAATKTYQLTSPDGKTSVVVNNDGALTYSVSRAGILLLSPSPIGMEISGGKEFGAGDKVKKVEKRSVDQILHPVIYKKSEVRDNFNEIKLIFHLVCYRHRSFHLSHHCFMKLLYCNLIFALLKKMLSVSKLIILRTGSLCQRER